MSQKMMINLVPRFRGREPIGREDIMKLKEEVRDAMRSGEKFSTEAGGGRSSRGKADFRRDWAENSLVGNIHEKTVMAEKILSEDA